MSRFLFPSLCAWRITMIIYYQLATLSSALHLLDTYSWFAHLAVLTVQYQTIIQKAKVKAASLLYILVVLIVRMGRECLLPLSHDVP
mgnify:CR=1 FL=1